MSLRNFKILIRLFSKWNSSNKIITAKSIKYCEHGKPAEVLQLVEDDLHEPKPNQVLVKILAAPVHNRDLSQVKGVSTASCAKKNLQMPAIPGIECVAQVDTVGSNVKELKPGQRVVVPYASGRGTWSTHAVYNVDDLAPIPNGIDLVDAATLTVVPCDAYRILKDFVELEAGDCVLLNGTNTALGQAVHQLCKAWGINSIGLINTTPDSEKEKTFFKNLGATEVFQLDELRQTNIFNDGSMPKPRLALCCVGRSSSKELASYLDHSGVMVTFGCMAGKPVATATASLVYRDFVQRPFWMLRWNKYNPEANERQRMLDELCCLMEKGEFKSPESEMVPMDDFQTALTAVQNLKGFSVKRYLLDMQCN